MYIALKMNGLFTDEVTRLCNCAQNSIDGLRLFQSYDALEGVILSGNTRAPGKVTPLLIAFLQGYLSGSRAGVNVFNPTGNTGAKIEVCASFGDAKDYLLS